MLAVRINRRRKLGSSFQGRIPSRLYGLIGAAIHTCGTGCHDTIANTHGIEWAKKPLVLELSASSDEAKLGML
jgi:hypothetical protein